MQDPYTTLGVSRNASVDEIKKAYRKLAHQYHPDKKGGNEAKFKEVNEAYQILSDSDKKARFDQFGHAGAPFGSAQDGPSSFDFESFGSGGFESIFDMFGGASHSSHRAVKGEDLHLEVRISSKDFGKRKIYEFEAFDGCGECSGTGAENGKLATCGTCHGQGRVRRAVQTPFGTFAQVVVCSQCSGDGQVALKKCGACHGNGRIKVKRTLELHIPKEIGDRYLVAFPKEGNTGAQGTPAGDLLVTLRVK